MCLRCQAANCVKAKEASGQTAGRDVSGRNSCDDQRSSVSRTWTDTGMWTSLGIP